MATRPVKILLSWVIFGLITGLLAVVFARTAPEPLPETAYLVKSSKGFSLVYFNSTGEVVAQDYRSLRRAYEAASDQRLHISPVTHSRKLIENVWSRADKGKTVLYWTMSSTQLVNRLTFDERADADFFREAFLSGAYSPSPHGHSIHFVRR